MRVIVDESAPQKLRSLIVGDHVVVTTSYQGWSGLKNGELLKLAETTGFELMITADQEFKYQQNLKNRRLSFLVLSTNNWERIKAYRDGINDAVNRITPGSYTELTIP